MPLVKSSSSRVADPKWMSLASGTKIVRRPCRSSLKHRSTSLNATGKCSSSKPPNFRRLNREASSRNRGHGPPYDRRDRISLFERHAEMHVRRNPAWPGHKSGVLDRPARGQQQCPRAAHIRLRRDTRQMIDPVAGYHFRIVVQEQEDVAARGSRRSLHSVRAGASPTLRRSRCHG